MTSRQHAAACRSRALLLPGTYKLGDLQRSGDLSRPQLPIRLHVSLPLGIPSDVPLPKRLGLPMVCSNSHLPHPPQDFIVLSTVEIN